jgi:hypothetical protein
MVKNGVAAEQGSEARASLFVFQQKRGRGEREVGEGIRLRALWSSISLKEKAGCVCPSGLLW